MESKNDTVDKALDGMSVAPGDEILKIGLRHGHGTFDQTRSPGPRSPRGRSVANMP